MMSGGVYRIKEHIGNIPGNVSGCRIASQEDRNKCKHAILEGRNKKKNKILEEQSCRAEVNISLDEEEDAEIEGIDGIKKPHQLGPMDRYASMITPENVSSSGSKVLRQKNINEALFKERTQQVQQYVGRWAYENGISFNDLDIDSFKQLMEAVGQFGPGFKPPTQYQLKEPLLKAEVERTKQLLKKHEKRRSILNLCVNCKEGTVFLESKESSNEAHTAGLIFEYVDKCVEQVGAHNVVQIVTDNATNNMTAVKLMKEKQPGIFWTSCATHTVNLMFESIGKLPRFKKIIDQAKSFTIFIYAHHKTLSLMISFTKKRDIVRPGVTSFESNFLTLQSLIEKKSSLRAMFTSDMWENCKWSKTNKGKLAYSTLMSMSFWNGVTLCLKIFAPLVRVLRLVDGDRKPSMGFLYGEFLRAKEDIKVALNNVESNYQPIIVILESKMKDRLDTSLHTTAFLLNPYLYYKDSSIALYGEIATGIFECMEVLHADEFELQDTIINKEFAKYRDETGLFGKALAAKACEKNDDTFDPCTWWSTYGAHTLNLLRVALRILSSTTSSSGC
ncbi:uncharacterized protein LOC142520502 [Primulina tabacum]|uniref:uncharacterized protein LOC142520502 n=1 Tax=Primulina tabacum TaxID=48773 RepID=UPI003F592D06